MAAIQTLVTAEELLLLPRGQFRYELIAGELHTMSPAGHVHGRLIPMIASPLYVYVRQHKLGAVYGAETGFILARNPDTVRAPEVAFITAERVAAVGDEPGYWVGAPDLAVEVLSPGDSYGEVEAKVFDWLDGGARMVVVVNGKRQTVTVYRSRSDIRVLVGDESLDGGDVVPGWVLPLQSIFA